MLCTVYAGFDRSSRDLAAVVRAVRPSALVGAASVGGAFTPDVLRALLAATRRGGATGGEGVVLQGGGVECEGMFKPDSPSGTLDRPTGGFSRLATGFLFEFRPS